jgi:hypothetical protein
MTYDDWKCASPEEGVDLGDNDVECIHGIDLLEPCAKCKPMAATGGEEEHVQDPDRSHITAPGDTYSVDEWIKTATTTELKRAYFAIDREVERRKAENAQEAKELATFDKPVRARRSDAGRPRQKPANEVARDEKGVAV